MFVWYLVALNGLGGLIVAVVVKYADNILKGFACSMAIIITCIVSGMCYWLKRDGGTQNSHLASYPIPKCTFLRGPYKRTLIGAQF